MILLDIRITVALEPKMLKCLVLLLCALSGYSAVLEKGKDSGDKGLWKGPEPGEGESHAARRPSKRQQFYLPPIAQPPQYPYLPIYIPYRQVVEVHHVVMLQQPTACLPQGGQLPPGLLPGGQQPVYPYPPATQPPFPEVTTESGLGDRMGGGRNDTATRRPSRCVWAIVACCSPESTSIRYSCFELLGCPGAFWGVNPCEPKVVQAAANTALNFYMRGGTDDGDVSQNKV